ncbi:MAG: HAMP domain-containing protein, partial [Anaerolineales bacterium]
MNFIVNLAASNGYFSLPQGFLGWLLWLLFAGGNLYLLLRWRKYQREYNRLRRIILTILAILTPLTAFFFGVRLPVGSALPAPGTTTLPEGAVLMFFAALPWILASSLVGPVAGGVLALVSGSILTFYDAHNLFVPLIYMLFGLTFGWSMLQSYRTLTYRLGRVPVVVGLAIILAYPVLFVLVTMLAARDSFAVRLDYALSLLPGISIAFAGQLLMGVVFAQVIALVAPQVWRGERDLAPSPAEVSLEAGLVYRLAPLGGLFAFLVLIVIGIFIFNANQQRLAVQMRNVADASGGSIPFSLETGQNLIVQLAEDERLVEADDSGEIEDILIEYLNKVPFFNQFTYLDSNERLIAAYPRQDLETIDFTIEERDAINLAIQGVSFQSYSLQPEDIGDPARLAFIVRVEGRSGETNVLLGRTGLDQNPFFIPVLENLESLTDIGGTAMLVDEQGMVLYHPDFSLIGTFYVGETDLRVPMYDVRHTAADGTREILYIQPVPGRSWAIVTTMPVEVAQQMTLETTLPLFVLLILLLVITFSILRLSVRSVIRSIGELADSATQVASGELDQSLETDRVDEVGQLANALEEMRLSLNARMEEVERLLSVSKGVASALEMDAAVNPILQGALSIGASSARLVLAETAVPEFEKNVRRHYGQGPSAE